MFDEAVYLNCDLPSTNQKLSDPEFFFEQYKKGTIIIFDEIHCLENPSMVLKIAADEFPQLKILATGSSTLSAIHKFKDSLSGRKTTIFLPPVIWEECQSIFKINNLDERLQKGGLPDMLLSQDIIHEYYSEWIDSFYARDINELFSIRQRTGFLKMLRMLFLQSGGLLKITNFAKVTGLSRPTISTYLEAMQIANAIFLLPPFFGGGKREIIRQPKCYGFDTGFVSFVNGWNILNENYKGF